MTVDEFFSTLSKVAGWILPILGIVVLVYLILVLKELLKTIQAATKTLDTTEQQLRKLDAPLSTAENISHTVDEVHETTKKAVKTCAGVIVKNAEQVKNWIGDITKSKNVSNDEEPIDHVEQEDAE